MRGYWRNFIRVSLENQRLCIEPNRRLSWKRPVLTYAEDRFSKSVDDILSGTVPAAESMVDYVECVFHRLAGEVDDPLERLAQVQGHLDCPCSCKRAKE